MTDCPYCGCPKAYNSGFSVKCRNSDCLFYDFDWSVEMCAEEDVEIELKVEDTTPLFVNPFHPFGDDDDPNLD